MVIDRDFDRVSAAAPVNRIVTSACFSNCEMCIRDRIYSALSTLKIGMEILEKESVDIECINGHGGLFKTPVVGQKFLAAALNTPVSVKMCIRDRSLLISFSPEKFQET